jgi:hypothetical protein
VVCLSVIQKPPKGGDLRQIWAVAPEERKKVNYKLHLGVIREAKTALCGGKARLSISLSVRDTVSTTKACGRFL